MKFVTKNVFVSNLKTNGSEKLVNYANNFFFILFAK